MLPPPMMSDWARKLIASEVDAGSLPAQRKGATLRVYEHLRRQFCAPVGADAFQALASRALRLAASQFPSLSAVSVTANGGLHGLSEVETPASSGDEVDVGTILIAQVLRLLTTLLGEVATVRLIEEASLGLEFRADPDATSPATFVRGTNYLGPFRDISLEADQLRGVSDRLESLANSHSDVDELLGLAGNIRNIATALDVFTLVRSKDVAPDDGITLPSTNGYLN